MSGFLCYILTDKSRKYSPAADGYNGKMQFEGVITW